METFTIGNATILQGSCLEALKQLPSESVQCCVTSPPYWGLRDYGNDGQIGLEATPEAYTVAIVEVFREVRRVLTADGTLWLNLGDSYSRQGGATDNKNPNRELAHMEGTQRRAMNKPAEGYKPKDLVGIPWMVAFALRADGWYLRSDIIWSKPNPMPESVTDRPTKAHEYLFLMAKSERYYYDHEAVKETAISTAPAGNGFSGRQGGSDRVGPLSGGTGTAERWEPGGKRNKRSVWEVATQPFSGAHFATFPPKLIEPCILAGDRTGDTILDPFNGSGTTGIVALKHDRHYIGMELNPEYVAITLPRIEEAQSQLKLALGC